MKLLPKTLFRITCVMFDPTIIAGGYQVFILIHTFFFPMLDFVRGEWIPIRDTDRLTVVTRSEEDFIHSWFGQSAISSEAVHGLQSHGV